MELYKITITATEEAGLSKSVQEALGDVHVALGDGAIDWKEDTVTSPEVVHVDGKPDAYKDGRRMVDLSTVAEPIHVYPDRAVYPDGTVVPRSDLKKQIVPTYDPVQAILEGNS